MLGIGGAIALAVWLLWPRLPAWVERRDAAIGESSVTFLVIALPEDGWRWDIVNDPAHPKTVAEWRAELDADVVFNAAYFGSDFTPTGYLRDTAAVGGAESAVAWPTTAEQADRFGYTFLVQPQAGGIQLGYLPDAPQNETTGDALLSFPTLLANGQPLIAENSGLYAARTVLAKDVHDVTYLIITERGNVTLYHLAQWLAQQPEQFVLAGNLDGGPSTGVSLENGRWDVEEPSASVPSVIVGYSAAPVPSSVWSSKPSSK